MFKFDIIDLFNSTFLFSLHNILTFKFKINKLFINKMKKIKKQLKILYFIRIFKFKNNSK